ncbi:MAG: hypothetical protein PHO86_04905 [Bacilli bacterium]|nr:hypothetical protein [Bacilli bacterium]
MIDTFFDKNLFQQIVSGLVILFVSILIGNKEIEKTSVSKFWKLIIILAWILFWGGLYLIIVNFPNGGIYNLKVCIGVSSASLGFIINIIGKFFIWWNK